MKFYFVNQHFTFILSAQKLKGYNLNPVAYCFYRKIKITTSFSDLH